MLLDSIWTVYYNIIQPVYRRRRRTTRHCSELSRYNNDNTIIFDFRLFVACDLRIRRVYFIRVRYYNTTIILRTWTCFWTPYCTPSTPIFDKFILWCLYVSQRALDNIRRVARIFYHVGWRFNGQNAETNLAARMTKSTLFFIDLSTDFGPDLFR